MNYKKIYENLITRAQNSNRTKGRGKYYEVHHILPKALGGDGKLHEWRTHPNLILLTAKEHFIAHLLLVQIHSKDAYKHSKMLHALSFFLAESKNHQRHKISSRTYERLKLELAELKKGVPRSKETIEKIKNTKRQNPWVPSQEYRKQCSERSRGSKNSMYGKTHTEEAKLKISQARKGKPNPAASKANKARTGQKLSYTKEVEQYSLSGDFLKSYVSITEAKRQTGIGSIICVLRGHQKTAGGYIWKYRTN